MFISILNLRYVCLQIIDKFSAFHRISEKNRVQKLQADYLFISKLISLSYKMDGML